MIPLRLSGGMAAAVLVLTGMAAAAFEGEVEAQRLMRQERWAEAETVLVPALQTNPAEADAKALRGMTRYHLGHYAEAVTDLESAMAAGTRHRPRCLYYLGLAHTKAGNRNGTVDAFSRLLIDHPASPEARRLGGIPTAINVPMAERRAFDIGAMLLLYEAGYSSNPELLDGGDGDLFMDLFASASLAQPTWPLTLGGSLFLEKFADLTDNDFLQLTADARRDLKFAEQARLEGIVEAGQSWLDSDAYERHLGLIGQYDLRITERLRGESRVELRRIAAQDDDETSDGTATSLRLRAYHYLENAGWLTWIRPELYVEDDARDTDTDGSQRWILGLECRCDLPERVRMDIGFRLASREYDGTWSATERTRSDTTWEGSATMRRPISRTCFLTAQARLTTRDSNVDDYSATDARMLLGFIWLP